MKKRILITGSGGFIGGFLVKRLLDEGNSIVAVDIKPLNEWYQVHDCVNYDNTDLKILQNCEKVCQNIDEVYNLACSMGGMGFIFNNRVECLHNVEIISNLIKIAYKNGVKKLFQSSSACVYNDDLQQTEIVSLKENDAWPAKPEAAYGLEKLYGEEFCIWYRKELGFDTRIARFHNVFGEHGTFDGGREKAPAAICRKVIAAKLSGNHEIEIWGDGNQTRSFMYIDDCIDGTRRLMESDFHDPLNIGSSEFVTINQLVDIAEKIAGIKLFRTYKLDAPVGVRGRNSDNTLIKQVLNWEPTINLETGLEKTYKWIYDQMVKK